MLQHGNMPLKTLIITNCKFLIFDEPAAAAGAWPGNQESQVTVAALGAQT